MRILNYLFNRLLVIGLQTEKDQERKRVPFSLSSTNLQEWGKRLFWKVHIYNESKKGSRVLRTPPPGIATLWRNPQELPDFQGTLSVWAAHRKQKNRLRKAKARINVQSSVVKVPVSRGHSRRHQGREHLEPSAKSSIWLWVLGPHKGVRP